MTHKIDRQTLQALADWYGRCDPDVPLALDREEGQSAYVPLDDFRPSPREPPMRLRGRPPVQDMLSVITLQSMQSPPESAQLFSGFRGTGKSTELSRLARELERTGDFAVLRFDVGEYHSRSRALTVEEMALVLAAGMGERALEKLGERLSPEWNVWKRIQSFLKSQVQAREFSWKIVPSLEIKGLIKASGDFHEKLAHLLADRPEVLREFLHGIVGELAQRLAGRQLVVLVDGLDRYSAPVDQVEQVYRQMAHLLANHHDLLALPRCHVVYTISPYFAFLQPGIVNAYKGSLYILSSVKVHERPPNRDSVFEPGVQALEQVLASRVDLHQLFGAQHGKCVRDMVRASGGHVRDLFHLAREVIRFALERGPPVDPATVREAIANVKAHRATIFRETRLLLAHVARAGSLDSLDQDQLGALCLAMDAYLVLCYWNGASWYDVHPLYLPQVRDLLSTDGAGEPGPPGSGH